VISFMAARAIKRRTKWKACTGLVAGLLVLAFAAGSGQLLVVDVPRRSDVIVVLAGETDRRPQRAFELLDRGYAPRLILDVSADSRIYQWTEPELAEKYVQGLPESKSITICAIHGLSTKEEASEAGRCLESIGGTRVLLVTSDYHTRRALSIFSREAPNRNYSVAAAHDTREFGVQWWRHREWAKTNLYEWMRLTWWELIDRWR
jgi:uncharacterized SAM-binding protein YcdF (DUF218 family)